MKKLIGRLKKIINQKRTKKGKILTGVIISILLLLLFLFLRFWFVVAIINLQPITRWYLNRELERQGGQQVLEERITELLIQQEIEKQQINVSQEEINQRIATIEQQLTSSNQHLDELLALQNQTRQTLEKQLKLQISIEKILSKNIAITDQEITDYFQTNQSLYPKGIKLEDKKEEIKNTLFRQKLSQNFPLWLNEIKQKAKIYYFAKIK